MTGSVTSYTLSSRGAELDYKPRFEVQPLGDGFAVFLVEVDGVPIYQVGRTYKYEGHAVDQAARLNTEHENTEIPILIRLLIGKSPCGFCSHDDAKFRRCAQCGDFICDAHAAWCAVCDDVNRFYCPHCITHVETAEVCPRHIKGALEDAAKATAHERFPGIAAVEAAQKRIVADFWRGLKAVSV